jgi:glycosyltransferase involved in cell wall biosynthesis
MSLDRSSVLCVLPLFPWPLRRNGISIRFAPILEYLNRHHHVDLLILTETGDSPPADWPAGLARSISILKLQVRSLPPLAHKLRTACIGLSPWAMPFGALPQLHKREVDRAILDCMRSRDYAAVLWSTGHFDIAFRVRRRTRNLRFVVDIVDSPALAILRARVTRPVLRTLKNYTAWKWRRWERRIHETFDASIYISPIDAAVAGSSMNKRIHVVPNGVSAPDTPLEFPVARHTGRTMAFLGNMAYPPNVSAALRLARDIFPQVRRVLPETRLLIVGRNPVEEIRSLARDSITVTGEVEQIWPLLSQADVFVFPLTEGAGLQNKILEAMYAGIPVVATPLAAYSLRAIHEEHLLVGESDEQLTGHAIQLLSDRSTAERLAKRAREFVMTKFSWQAILAQYEAIVLGHTPDPSGPPVGAEPYLTRP